MSVITQNTVIEQDAYEVSSEEELLTFIIVSDDERISEECPKALGYIDAARKLLKQAEDIIEDRN